MKKNTIPIDRIAYFKEDSESNKNEYGNSIIPFSLLPINQSQSLQSF